MRYVIVGNSYAGVSAVEAVREIDRQGEIVVVSDEPYHAYARPMISYFLGGKVGPQALYYRQPEFYSNAGVRLLLRKRVTGLDDSEQAVRLADGTFIPFDRLLLSTGGKPTLPPLAGLGARQIFTFTKWDDAWALRRIAEPRKKAVVFGGGLIGLKAAEGLRNLGLDVTLIARRRLLALVLDEFASSLLHKQLADHGIRLVIGSQGKEILADRRGNVCGIELEDGTRLQCSILVLATGVRPNTDFIGDGSMAVNKGIIVNRRMETGRRHVYAAGDVAEAWDLLAGKNSVIAIAPLAAEQGKVAGYNMAGAERTYAGGFGMNSIEVSGLPFMALGISNQDADRHETVIHRDGPVYRKLVFDRNRLVGALLVGDVRFGGVLTHIIRSRADLRDGPGMDAVKDSVHTGDFVRLRAWNMIQPGRRST